VDLLNAEHVGVGDELAQNRQPLPHSEGCSSDWLSKQSGGVPSGNAEAAEGKGSSALEVAAFMNTIFKLKGIIRQARIVNIVKINGGIWQAFITEIVRLRGSCREIGWHTASGP
jgi:hypothetical protein